MSTESGFRIEYVDRSGQARERGPFATRANALRAVKELRARGCTAVRAFGFSRGLAPGGVSRRLTGDPPGIGHNRGR